MFNWCSKDIIDVRCWSMWPIQNQIKYNTTYSNHQRFVMVSGGRGQECVRCLFLFLTRTYEEFTIRILQFTIQQPGAELVHKHFVDVGKYSVIGKQNYKTSAHDKQDQSLNTKVLFHFVNWIGNVCKVSFFTNSTWIDVFLSNLHNMVRSKIN